MKCYNCKSEIGNLQVCPYCGATAYLQEAYRAPQTPDARANKRRPSEMRDLDRRLRVLETKVNLCLTIQCGTFAIAILMLLLMALR